MSTVTYQRVYAVSKGEPVLIGEIHSNHAASQIAYNVANSGTSATASCVFISYVKVISNPYSCGDTNCLESGCEPFRSVVVRNSVVFGDAPEELLPEVTVGVPDYLDVF